MKVLSIGMSSFEITSEVTDGIVSGANLELTNFTESCGGYAGNVAYLLSKWGVETYIASMLGSDDEASRIKKDYETVGTKTDYIETCFDRPTTRTIILVNKNDQTETVLNLPSNSFLKKYMFAIEPDIIFSDGTDYTATLTAFDKNPKKIKVIGIKNPTKEVIELGKFADFVIVSKESAEVITNKKIDFNDSSTLVNVYNMLKQKYKGEVIITLGDRGSIYAINSQVKIMPPVKCDYVDSYGAGTIYTGIFIYAIGRNFGLEKAIAYATIGASLSISKLTTRGSIPTITEVSNYYDSKFGSENNPIPKEDLINAKEPSNETQQNAATNVPEMNTVVAKEIANPTNVSNTVNLSTDEGISVSDAVDMSVNDTTKNS